MRSAWRLATNSLSARRNRSALLVGCVALCAALITSVACSITSVNHNVERRLLDTVGAADLRLVKPGSAVFDADLLKQIDAWPETKLAVGRAQEALPLRNTHGEREHVAIGYGVDPAREFLLRPLTLVSGRLLDRDGEVVLDARAAEALGASVGDTLTVPKFGSPVSLTLVGIVQPPPLGAIFTKTPAYVTLATLGSATDQPARLSEMDIVVREGVDAESVATTRKAEMPPGLILQPSAKITSGLKKNQQSSRIGFVLAGLTAFLASSFIIMTALTTNLAERTRELAVLRCIGAEKSTLAAAQVFVGLIIGVLGALAGVPLGIALAWGMVQVMHKQLPAGFQMAYVGLALSIVGSVGAGLIGASWPAISASRVSPLTGLSVRARKVPGAWLWACVLVGVLGPACQLGIVTLVHDRDALFWSYLLGGLPPMFLGYFLLGVPVTMLVNRLVSPALSRGLGLPRDLLGRVIAGTPYRHGFTTSAMMIGLAMMTSIWTNGRSVLGDWIDQLQFPDMFAYGLNLTPQTAQRLGTIPGVASTCAIGTLNVEMNQLASDGTERSALGIAGLTSYRTTYIGFEPGPFFDMTKLTWVQGDADTARRELERGGAILVAREFLTARGLGVGQTVRLKLADRAGDFRIVGVVTSPGLDVASKFYSVGEEYVDQAVNSVFGSMRDMQRVFGASNVQLIQLALAPGADAKGVLRQVRSLRGTGILEAGDGTAIKKEIRGFVSGALGAFALIAVGAMCIACFGVANLIIAGVQARQFEFGVLRSMGAQRGLLARLVIAEALVIAIGACALGTALGIQGAFGGRAITRSSIGLDLAFNPPVLPIAASWVLVTLIVLAAAAPTAVRLAKRHPRELLGAMKG